MSEESSNGEMVFVGAHVGSHQVAWLDRMARMNGGMSRAAAIRRLIDNAMRGETREQTEETPCQSQ